MVPLIRIKLEITPADGSAKPCTFPSFREAAEYTGLSISGLRDAYHRGRTRVSRRDGTEFKLKWQYMLPAKFQEEPRHNGNCEWLIKDGTRCNVPLTIEDKVRPFYMRTIGKYGDKLEKMMFTSIKDGSEWSGVSQNQLRNACEKNNNYVIRRSDKQKFWLLWGEYCLKYGHLEHYGYIKNGVSELTPAEEDRRFSKAVTNSGGLEEYKRAALRNLRRSVRDWVKTQEVKAFRSPEDFRDNR